MVNTLTSYIQPGQVCIKKKCNKKGHKVQTILTGPGVPPPKKKRILPNKEKKNKRRKPSDTDDAPPKETPPKKDPKKTCDDVQDNVESVDSKMQCSQDEDYEPGSQSAQEMSDDYCEDEAYYYNCITSTEGTECYPSNCLYHNWQYMTEGDEGTSK